MHIVLCLRLAVKHWGHKIGFIFEGNSTSDASFDDVDLNKQVES